MSALTELAALEALLGLPTAVDSPLRSRLAAALDALDGRTDTGHSGRASGATPTESSNTYDTVLNSVEAAAERALAGHEDEARAELALFMAETDRYCRVAVLALGKVAQLIAGVHGRPERTTVAPDGWCPSCYREGQYHEPTALDRKGAIAYPEGLCGWCGRFVAAWGRMPTVRLVELHHEGKRITTTILQREGFR